MTSMLSFPFSFTSHIQCLDVYSHDEAFYVLKFFIVISQRGIISLSVFFDARNKSWKVDSEDFLERKFNCGFKDLSWDFGSLGKIFCRKLTLGFQSLRFNCYEDLMFIQNFNKIYRSATNFNDTENKKVLNYTT